MHDVYGNDFFSTNIWMLTVSGLWFSKNCSKNFTRFYSIFNKLILSMSVYFAIAEFISLKDSYQDEYDLSKNLTVALTHALGTFKQLFVFRYMGKFRRIMSLLEYDNFRYEICEEFEFYPGRIYKKFRTTGRIWSRLFLFFSISTAITGIGPQFVSGILVAIKPGEFFLPTTLPYRIWTPFKYDTLFWYFLALLYQSIPVFYHAFGIISVDTLFMNIMNCISSNLTIIQGAFRSIVKRCDKSEGLGHERETKLRVEMKKVCTHLQTIYQCCEYLENTYNFVCLLQTGLSVFIICSSLYLVFTTPFGDEKLYNELFYIVTVSFQLTVYCWFGNEVTLRAAEIPLNIYKSDWQTSGVLIKREILLTMSRANGPLYMTAGKFVPLTLGTLMQIMKGAYSFFAFMKRSQKK